MRIQYLAPAAAVIAALALAGCTPSKVADNTSASPPPAAPPAAPKLPVSINAVMVAMVDHAAEPVWVSGYKPPTSKEGWRNLEYNAYQVAVNGKLIQLVGTGPDDAKWAADPEWTRFADAMSAAGMDTLTAAKAKDTTALNTAGDRLVEACEGCHKKFKPGLTTGGLYKAPDDPKT